MDQTIPIFSVTQFNEMVNSVLTEMRVWVKGEISGYRVSQGKWVTFDLKDEGSKVNCFMTTYQLDQQLEDGMEVKVFGNPRIYVPYGKYSFTVQRVEPVGEGALMRAFLLTKAKLEEEGIFSPEHKKPIPRFPETIGIVTSQEAAAYTDFLRILNNRWGGVSVTLRPVLVQGNNAPGEIVEAIEWFNKYHPVDVLVVTRGGGSLEDLQAFNSESVCRAIFASKIPVVCGVGHERDTTLAELAADVRASTPSNAAERVVPDRQEILWQLEQAQKSMNDCLVSKTSEHHWNLDHFLSRMEHTLQIRFRNFAQLEHELHLAFQGHRRKLDLLAERLQIVRERLEQRMGSLLSGYRQQLRHHTQLLSTLSPKEVVKRGYSITRLANGKVLSSVKQIQSGQTIQTELADGSVFSEVQSKGKKPIENGRLF